MFNIRASEEINIELYEYIEKHHPDQIENVFNQDMVEILPDFLGFIDIYYNLSKIIPCHYTVIDFGCGYNAQSFYFMNHKRYIGIDIWPNIIRFQAPGTEFYESHIEDYIDYIVTNKFDIKSIFAICSYVPDSKGHIKQLIKENFDNLFIFYPSDDCGVRL